MIFILINLRGGLFSLFTAFGPALDWDIKGTFRQKLRCEFKSYPVGQLASELQIVSRRRYSELFSLHLKTLLIIPPLDVVSIVCLRIQRVCEQSAFKKGKKQENIAFFLTKKKGLHYFTTLEKTRCTEQTKTKRRVLQRCLMKTVGKMKKIGEQSIFQN